MKTRFVAFMRKTLEYFHFFYIYYQIILELSAEILLSFSSFSLILGFQACSDHLVTRENAIQYETKILYHNIVNYYLRNKDSKSK